MTYDRLLRAVTGKGYHNPKQGMVLRRQIAGAHLTEEERTLLVEGLKARMGRDAKIVDRRGMEGLRPTARASRRRARRRARR